MEKLYNWKNVFDKKPNKVFFFFQEVDSIFLFKIIFIFSLLDFCKEILFFFLGWSLTVTVNKKIFYSISNNCNCKCPSVWLTFLSSVGLSITSQNLLWSHTKGPVAAAGRKYPDYRPPDLLPAAASLLHEREPAGAGLLSAGGAARSAGSRATRAHFRHVHHDRHDRSDQAILIWTIFLYLFRFNKRK